MYAGEVSVDQERLPKLLEAARILRIKGLWDSDQEQGASGDDEEDDEEEEEMKSPLEAVKSSLDAILGVKMNQTNEDVTTTTTNVAPVVLTSNNPVGTALSGSQKRKRKKTLTPPPPPSLTSLKPVEVKKDEKSTVSPLFGISNAYFVTSEQQLQEKPAKKKAKKSPINNCIKKENCEPVLPIPTNLLNLPLPPPPTSSSAANAMPTNTDLPIPPFLSQLAAKTSETLSSNNTKKTQQQQQQAQPQPQLTIGNFDAVASALISSTPVRRYKQYTEQSLQSALREIMEGQSINRSSMKFNIPARTLRDWMKRLNIKSVFTHHPPANKEDKVNNASKGTSDGGSTDCDASSVASTSSSSKKSGEMERDQEEDEDEDEEEEEVMPEVAQQSARVVFPGMPLPTAINQKKDGSNIDGEEEEEDEIDDDEEESLKIDEQG